MDQRHLLEKQRSQLVSQRGLVRPPHQLPVRPPLSPFIASQLSHQSASPISTDRFPAPVFAGRVQQQPHLACAAGPASPHLLERQQRELKDASIMQAKFAQQRAMLAHQVNPTPSHGMEDRVQYVPALLPNMSPEDSLAQLRRLHQQVLSMPNQEPHLFEVPSPNRPRREVQREVPPDVEVLGFASKERMQLMEKHLLNSKKQLNSSEQHERIAFYRDRMQQQSSAAQGESSYSMIGNRLTPNRPSIFSRTDLATQTLNYRLYQNSAAESARMIQEIEKQREQEHLTRHDQLAFQQKQLPSPGPRLSSHDVSPRIFPSIRSRLHASYFASHERQKETTSSVRWEQNIGMPSHMKRHSEQSLPQIKYVKSLANVKNVQDEVAPRRIDQRDALMKLMENRIKHELDKEDEPCPPTHDVKAHSKRSDSSSAMTKVPSHPPTSIPPPPLAPSAMPHTVQMHVKEEPLDSLEEKLSSPQDLSSPSLQVSNSGVEKPFRKRPAACNAEVPPSTKRSRGSGDIFKSRLSEYTSLPSCSRASTGDGTVSSSILPAGSKSPSSVEQPLDLSLNNTSQRCVHAGRQGTSCRELPVPLNKSFNAFPHITQLGKLGSKLESPTISDIISHAVAASLEKPYEVPNCIEEDKDTTREPSAQTSSTPEKDEQTATDSDPGESTVSEEECQQQLIDLLSTQFAGSFRNFLVSLLSECKNDSVVKTLAISKAGEKVPIVMKEELERCNLKISQTIRTLLESGDDKVKHKKPRKEGTSSEARVENDTSPPCQVSTTTDIWQHSPPASPADGDLITRSQKSAPKLQMEGRLEDTESSRRAKQEKVDDDQLHGKHVGDLEERKMPSIMKVESLAQLSEHKLQKTVRNVFMEDNVKENHHPLYIDHDSVMVDESAKIENYANPADEVAAKPSKGMEIEEDAIDFLKFGNEEIDAGEKKKNSEKKFTLFKDKSETMIGSGCMDSSPGSTCSDRTVKTESQQSDSTPKIRVKTGNERVTGNEVLKDRSVGEATIETTNVDKSVHSNSNSRDCATDVTELEEKQAYELNDEESELVIAEGVTNEGELDEGEFSAARDPVSLMGNKVIVQSKKSPPSILPKQQPIPFASVIPSKPPPLTMVSTPISIALPQLYQMTVPSHQLVQIVPSPVTNNIVCTLAPPASSVPLSPPLLSSSSVTVNSLVCQANQSPTLSSSPSLLVSTQSSAPLSLSQRDSTQKVQVAVSTASQSKVLPVDPPTGAATTPSTAGTRPSTSHIRPSSQSSEPPLSTFPQNQNSSKCWKGNLLIPQSTPQEQSNSKKPFVLAYSVVYHSAHLPCVLRSSVPFVPPKILWKNLFPKVSFTDFSKTLSACLILQRYMTVMEQAALQNNLTANGISSCKLVPLDELDDKFKEVQEKLEMGAAAQGNSDCNITDG